MKAVASTENSAALSPVAREARTSAGPAPLRVLHVIDRLDMGGTEYVILKVMAGLGAAEFEHRVCAARGYNEALPHLQKMRDQIVVAGRNESKFQLLLFSLARIMREFRPHVVHSRNWGAIEAIPAARLARVPVAIHSEHGYIPDMLAGLPTRQRVIRRGAYAMADAVFCVTEELRNYHARQAWIAPSAFAFCTMALIPPAIRRSPICAAPLASATKFRPPPSSSASSAASWRLRTTPLYFAPPSASPPTK